MEKPPKRKKRANETMTFQPTPEVRKLYKEQKERLPEEYVTNSDIINRALRFGLKDAADVLVYQWEREQAAMGGRPQAARSSW